jgi:two-component system chemotaxis response regulator CheY
MAFNVLIVDDSSSMRAVIKKVIKVSGFNIGCYWEAGDGNEALKILRNEWVDLVLSDINMPNMSGLELIRKMKEDDTLSNIPVIMVTTEGSNDKVNTAKDLGASGYIKKPFLPEEIRMTLCEIMGEEVSDERDDNELETGDF